MNKLFLMTGLATPSLHRAHAVDINAGDWNGEDGGLAPARSPRMAT